MNCNLPGCLVRGEQFAFHYYLLIDTMIFVELRVVGGGESRGLLTSCGVDNVSERQLPSR